MAKRIRSLDDIRIDIFEALKRAYIKRGFIPRFKKVESGEKKGGSSDDSSDHAEKLAELTAKSHEVLLEAKTVGLFPDTIRIDREKLTIANRSFFRVARIISVPISSILSAEADVGPFFGSLHMSSKYFVQDHYSLTYLWRHDTIAIQRLLQGYIIAHDHEIDCSGLDKRELISRLNELGRGPAN